jgi:phosphoserine phosphatase
MYLLQIIHKDFALTQASLQTLEGLPSFQFIKSQNKNELVCNYWKFTESLSSDLQSKIRNNFQNSMSDFLFIDAFINPKKEFLFAFDMDSTLIQQEVIDELARANGVYSQVAEITERAMQGELDFNSALRARCELLKGVSTNTFEEVFQIITPSQGVDSFLRSIKSYPSRLAVFSGGFVPIVRKFAEIYSFDEYRANTLEEQNRILTGNVIGEIVNRQKKKEYLLEVQTKYKIETSQVVAVGDGSNDLDMLQSAGIGIGFHPKEGLKKQIQNWLDFAGMDALEFLLDH